MDYDIESGKIEASEYICQMCHKNPDEHCIHILGISNDSFYFYFSPFESKNLKDTDELLNHIYGHLQFNTKKWILLLDCSNMRLSDIYYLNNLKILFINLNLNLDFTLLDNIVLLNYSFLNSIILNFLFKDYHLFLKNKLIYDKNNSFSHLIELYFDE